MGSMAGFPNIHMIHLHGGDFFLKVRGVPFDVNAIPNFEATLRHMNARDVGMVVKMVYRANLFFSAFHSRPPIHLDLF
jgi:hypothetical protein